MIPSNPTNLRRELLASSGYITEFEHGAVLAPKVCLGHEIGFAAAIGRIVRPSPAASSITPAFVRAHST